MKLHRFSALLALALGCLLGFAGQADAATQRIWTGAGDGVHWSDPNNWSNGAPVAGDGVTFKSPATSTDDVAGAISNILFTSTAGGSTINGSINLNASIETINILSESDGNRINAPIAFTSAPLFVKSATAGQKLTLAGVISGTGLGVRVYGPGIVEYAQISNNTYTGSTVVASNDAIGSAGILQLNSASAGGLVPGALQIGGTNSGQPADSAQLRLISRDDIVNTSAVTVNADGLLDLNGQNEAIESASVMGDIRQGGGSLTVFGGLSLANSASIASTGGAPLILTSVGSITATGSPTITSPIETNSLGSFTFPIAVNGGSLALDSITATNSSSTLSVAKSGTGTLELDGESSYTGGTEVSAGTLLLKPTATLITGGLAMNGSSLDVEAAGNGEFGSVTTLGAPTLSSASLQLTAAPGSPIPAHSRLRIIETLASNPVNGTFTGLPEGSTVAAGAQTFKLSYLGGTGNDVELSLLNSAPLLAAGASATPSLGTAGKPVSFSAAAADPDGDTLTYAWSFGDGTAGTGATATHTYSAPGTYNVSVTITDGFGGSISSATSVTINPAPGASTPPPSGSTSSIAPTLTSFAQTNTKWRAGKALAVFAKATKRAPLGTQLSFTLSGAATVSLAFTQSTTGRKSGKHCVAQTTKNSKAKSCKLTLAVGTVVHSAHSGKNTVSFQGRISNSKTLKPGRYTVIATANNSTGQRSKPSSLSFTIVK